MVVIASCGVDVSRPELEARGNTDREISLSKWPISSMQSNHHHFIGPFLLLLVAVKQCKSTTTSLDTREPILDPTLTRSSEWYNSRIDIIGA